MALDNTWFSEADETSGAAFSLKLTDAALLESRQSPFQKIDIYDTTKFGKLMVIDGYTMVSTRDNFLYHEMMSHPVLFTHPNPKRVVIIGGGDCGTLREVLRHPGVTQVIQIDIDEQVTRLAEKYFPELCESNDDARATIAWEDGLKYMKEVEAGSIDVVIVDSTDPVGPAEGLFSAPFYQDVFAALADDGIVVQQSESPMYHLDHILLPLHKMMKGVGFSHTQTFNFPQPLYPSGWWTGTMASKSTILNQFRTDDIVAKAFDCQYYNAEIHQAALAMPEFVKKALADI